MKNVSRGTIQEKNMGADKMKKNEKMSLAINEFILENDFLVRFITDNVKEKIYDTKEYHESMIEEVLVNDLDNGYSDSYILGFIIDEIDIYQLIDKIDNLYHDDFIELANECNN